MSVDGRAERFVVVVLLLFLPFVAACQRVAESKGTGVTAAVANDRLHQDFRLPDEAFDVDYYSTVHFSVAEFAISESDFVNWCDKMRLVHGEIVEGKPGAMYYFADQTKSPVGVFSGVFGSEGTDDGHGFAAVFDRESKKASVTYSMH